MPSRSQPFITGKAYHLYDKTLDTIKIFEDHNSCLAFLRALSYYRFYVPDISLSAYRRFSTTEQLLVRQEYMREQDALITIHAFVLMPNHYHLLVRQKKDGALVQCISNVMNSITRYYNRRNLRKGPVFLPQFNSVTIHNIAQLSYVSKYIHRNPLKANLVRNFDELKQWRYSSLPKYLGHESLYDWIKPTYVMRNFGYSEKLYQKYMVDDEISV